MKQTQIPGTEPPEKNARAHKIAEHVRRYAASTAGSTHLYRHWMGHLCHTDGVEFLARIAGAYWLVDLIASHQTDERVRAEDFQVWILRTARRGYPAVLATCEDGNGNVVTQQLVEYTDFPEELLPFRLFAERGEAGLHLMLPEER